MSRPKSHISEFSTNPVAPNQTELPGVYRDHARWF